MTYSNVSILRDKDGNPIPQYLDSVEGVFKPLTEESKVKITGSNVQDVTLQDAAIAAGNGTVFNVGSVKTLTLEITGTSTSRTIAFEGASVSGTYYPIQGIKLTDLSMDTQTTGTGEVWTFEVTGLVSFRARILAIAGGNVTVKGKAVA